MNLCRCAPNTAAGAGAQPGSSQSLGSSRSLPFPGPGLSLAMASVPMQPWETPYDAAKALKQGTIFPSLDLPFYVTGGGING